ncbi:hypothetical protein U27_05894 [Candidatus Vecturithrix granuli]|uniref:AAA-ATPase-like domain-containing protein n=1 Tax=Vecturithrix granuli TaxID=1499967 RepID=A0A081C2W4_VECG1|nr:hypothetical protein U27_05894 [Candidatus Vecturithrix granuli]
MWNDRNEKQQSMKHVVRNFCCYRERARNYLTACLYLTYRDPIIFDDHKHYAANLQTQPMAAYQKPKRTFEEAGLVDPKTSYYVTLEHVVNTRNQDIYTMIDLGRYFSIFAPRQSGKTSFLYRICEELRDNLSYIPILLSFQTYKNLDVPGFYAQIQIDLYAQILQRLQTEKNPPITEVEMYLASHPLTNHAAFFRLFENLSLHLPSQRIVLFIDEFDGIPRQELENFLTTLRELYQKYKTQEYKALHSVGLVGIRNITKLIVGGVSPFNIADQVKLPPFTLNNVRDLYAQYTTETNQPFTGEAIQRVYESTAGQVWLVNRLGTILTVNIKPDTVEPITAGDVDLAVNTLLLERNSHFDNLVEKAKLYRETFISIVFNGVQYNPDDEDQSWLEQYGLIREAHDQAVVANAIYQQRFVRAFFKETQVETDISYSGYFTPDGFLDMDAVLADFEEYIMRIGVRAFYDRQKPYESTGQFLLTAWLYQFVQGGQGELRYEPSIGLGWMDILLTYHGRKYIFETKLNRYKLQTTIDKAVEQLSKKYLLPERADEGYVVIFDLKTPVGELHEPQRSVRQGKEIVSIIIGIGES